MLRKTKHTMTRDFAKGRGELMRMTHPGGRRGGAPHSFRSRGRR